MQNHSLSRRHLMGRMSRAALGAPLGAVLLGSDAQAAEPASVAVDAPGLRTYDVRHYGAHGDGKTLDTAAFQAAIDACADDRGGAVLVPAGDFLIGSIELKSNVTLHLASAARLVGSTRVEDYKKGMERGPYGSIALIYANEAENVSIEGKGAIDGQGAAFRGRPDDRRPFLLLFNACKNLSIRDLYAANGAFWCTHFNGCEYVEIDGLRIHTRVVPNNDGLHFDDSRHVRISNCDIACGDDACCFFGSNRYVTVTNCTFSTRWSVFRFGEGTTEDFAISNCVI